MPITELYVEKLVSGFEQMKKELTEQRDWYWSCRGRSYFMEIIIALERLYGMLDGKMSINQGQLPLKPPNEKLKKAILFIESHYADNISLPDIVKSSESNHTSLTLSFKQELGLTSIEYLWDYRHNIAKKQLAFTNIPIKEIALRGSFKTLQHFSRSFKERTGYTPAQYRRVTLQKRKNEIKP